MTWGNEDERGLSTSECDAVGITVKGNRAGEERAIHDHNQRCSNTRFLGLVGMGVIDL